MYRWKNDDGVELLFSDPWGAVERGRKAIREGLLPMQQRGRRLGIQPGNQPALILVLGFTKARCSCVLS